MTAAVTRGPGRPRSESIDAAILQATTDELIERGFLAASMESIAARAGVAKTTLYRRWPNTTELAVAAMRSFETDTLDVPPGSVRDNLIWLITQMGRKWSDPRWAALMRRVAADGSAGHRGGPDQTGRRRRLAAAADRLADHGCGPDPA